MVLVAHVTWFVAQTTWLRTPVKISPTPGTQFQEQDFFCISTHSQISSEHQGVIVTYTYIHTYIHRERVSKREKEIEKEHMREMDICREQERERMSKRKREKERERER